MDNKNEKTFADLFSSSAPDEDNSNEIHFGDLTDELANEEEKKDSVLTFDNLFDKIVDDSLPSKEEPVTPKVESEGLNRFFEENSSIEKNEEQEFQKPFNLNGIIFDSKETNAERKEEEKKIVDSSSNFNPFFEEEKDKVILDENNEKEEISDIFSFAKEEKATEEFLNEKVSKSSELEVDKKEMTGGENPLFQSFSDDETDLNDVSVETENTSLDNPFFSQSELEKDMSPEEPQEILEKEENVFFQEESGTSNSSIFEGESLFKDVQEPIVNPLLSEEVKDTKKEKDLVEEEDVSDFWKDSKVVSEEVVEESRSISPFFEEETVKEENPLFLEKINLIENVSTPKKTGMIDVRNSKHFDVKIVKKKEPLIKFILGVISYAIFIWLLLIGVTLLVYVLDIKIRAAKGDYSAPTFNAYVVLTGSMLPEIQVYDVVVTKKVESSELEEGDVITFASADTRFLNTIITHRILKKNYDAETKSYTFQTKGDNNNVADSALVPENNIYGKVILKIPKLGYLQEFLASDGGWIIVILIPCLTVISYDIVKLVKGMKRKKYKNIKVQK